MSSMNTDHADIEKVTYFMLHVITIVRNEKNHLEIVAMRCCMLEKANKKVRTYKITAARSKVLNYENIASTFS